MSYTLSLQIQNNSYTYSGSNLYEKGQIELYAQYLFGNELQMLQSTQPTIIKVQFNNQNYYFQTEITPYINPIQTSYCFKDIAGIILQNTTQKLDLMFTIQKTCEFLLENNFTAEANLFIPGNNISIIMFSGFAYIQQFQSQLSLEAKLGDTTVLKTNNIYNTQVSIQQNGQMIFNELVEISVDSQHTQRPLWVQVMLITLLSIFTIFVFSFVYKIIIYIRDKNVGRKELNKNLQELQIFQYFINDKEITKEEESLLV